MTSTYLFMIIVVTTFVWIKGDNLTLTVVISHSFTDVDDCRSNPCQHGGTCIDGHFSYTCRCNDYYKGANCQTGMIL